MRNILIQKKKQRENEKSLVYQDVVTNLILPQMETWSLHLLGHLLNTIKMKLPAW